jgi:hypothetical protein
MPRRARYVRLSVDCGEEPISFGDIGVCEKPQEGLADVR